MGNEWIIWIIFLVIHHLILQEKSKKYERKMLDYKKDLAFLELKVDLDKGFTAIWSSENIVLIVPESESVIKNSRLFIDDNDLYLKCKEFTSYEQFSLFYKRSELSGKNCYIENRNDYYRTIAHTYWGLTYPILDFYFRKRAQLNNTHSIRQIPNTKL